MRINWFPGHMNRARREIASAIRKVDVVIEVVDARLPRSSRNPLLARIAADRPVLPVLSKADLADPDATEAWIAAWADRRPLALALDDPRAVRRVPARCRELAPHRGGGPGRTLRLLVVGIPNVGKSTLINSLLGRRVARVGDRPAITRQAQRVELERDVSIFDSPGVLWLRLDDQEGARRLAASGAIRETAFEPIEIAAWAVGFLARRYAPLLARRFGLDELLGDPPARTSEAASDPARDLALLEAIGRRRGALRSGGHVDLERSADLFLRELRAGKIGPISFERPEDPTDEPRDRAEAPADESPERPEGPTGESPGRAEDPTDAAPGRAKAQSAEPPDEPRERRRPPDRPAPARERDDGDEGGDGAASSSSNAR